MMNKICRCYIPHCRGFTRRPVDEYICGRHYRMGDKALKKAFHEAIGHAEKLRKSNAKHIPLVLAYDAAYLAWVPFRDDVLAKAMP